MRILVYAADPADRKLSGLLAKALPRGAELELLAYASFLKTYKKKAPGAFVYLDAGAEPDAGRLADQGAKLASLALCAWGVVDRGGAIADPAILFFAGARDYIGKSLAREGLPPGRLGRALASAGLAPAAAPSPDSAASAFPGWGALSPGDQVQVRFCYAAVGNQRELLERIGEKRLHKLKEDFAAFLEPWAKECGGIEWIRDQSGSLLLFPPKDEGMNPVLAAFRLLLDRALVGYEVFRLETPLSFRFAFHSGVTMWRPPGSTGTVVSDDVNFIFHLGTKAAADGAIVASEEAERSVPPFLRDLFSPAGDFEGRRLSASKRFRD
ncbi:MAG TPA: hypothetical protein PLB91_12120 [Spirochaetales bacterium]|nr:hypothetical protein [Spirochaetales bacterium]HRY54575.1 hypothetical protein [Spirochaetia bacterium]HRZ64583.1 hypothetical protein [Spirochaetia bacterium]